MPVDAPALRIVHYPDPILYQRAKPVAVVDDSVRAVAARMLQIMVEEEGIGLAAPQVGLPWRLFVVDVPPDEGRSPDADPATATRGPLAFVNPVLSDLRGDPEPFNEGCLSLPDIRGEVCRPPLATLTATDLDGRPVTLRAGGLLARCLQHEMDHLDGVLILSRFPKADLDRNQPAIRELARQGRLALRPEPPSKPRRPRSTSS